jgi:signal transduction histidine kinase
VFFTALFLALCIGTLAFWLITRNLHRIIDVVRKFRDGDYKVRIETRKSGDLNLLSTTFNEMADKIVDSIESLKSVETLRRELIANVSHDLRTPLSIIKGYVETLQLKGRSLSPEEKEKYLDIILESTGKLSTLVTQLFEYSKLEANEIKPLKEPFSLCDLVQDTLQQYKMILEERNISLTSNLENQVPLVFGDVSLIERVITNLMDNAIKYTPTGGSINVVIVTGDNSVLFRIEDSGPGIAESEQKYIFERFKQGQENRKAKSGAGLGLAIAKKILDIHASYIKVESQPNKGAVFIFSLPQHISNQQRVSVA